MMFRLKFQNFPQPEIAGLLTSTPGQKRPFYSIDSALGMNNFSHSNRLFKEFGSRNF